MKLGGKKGKENQWVCPYLSPECGERGLKNQGCEVSPFCIGISKEEKTVGKLKAKTTKLVDLTRTGIYLEYHDDHSGAIFFEPSTLRSHWVVKVYGLYASPIHVKWRGFPGKLIWGDINSKTNFIDTTMGLIRVVTNLTETEIEEVEITLEEVL